MAAPQSLKTIFARYFDAMDRRDKGSGFVVNGCTPSAHGAASLQVDVAAGTFVSNKGRYTAYAGGNKTPAAASATTTRVDLLYFDTAGVLQLAAGTGVVPNVALGTVPVPPAIPTAATAIALVYIPPTVTDYSTTAYVFDITQVRTDMGEMSVRAFGATGDGSTNDQAAFATALALGGTIVVPKGTYRLATAITVSDGTSLIMADDAVLYLEASVILGGVGAVIPNVRARLRVQSNGGYTGTLVECYNLLGHKAFPQVSVELTAASASDFVHIHSTNGHGAADCDYLLSTNNYLCKNGLLLCCGDDAGTPSIAGDFINGNVIRGSLACTNNGIQSRGTGPVGGSVQGSIARNFFERIDTNSYGAPAGAGRGLLAVNDGMTRCEFIGCTWESAGGGAAIDIDTSLATGGQYFRHPITRTKSTQSLANRDVWVDDEFDNADDYGIYPEVRTDGAASLPAYGYRSDTDTGFFRVGANQHAATAGEKSVMLFTGTSSLANGYVNVENAISTGAPAVGASNAAATNVNLNLKTQGTGRVLAMGDPLSQVIAWATANQAPSSTGASVVYSAIGQSTFNVSEADRQFPIPRHGRISRLQVFTGGAQPADGGMVVKVRKSGVSTPIEVSIPSLGGSGQYNDTINTTEVSAGDRIAIQFTNRSAASAGAIITGIALQLDIGVSY